MPTITASLSEHDFLSRFQISRVKIVLELLKIEVRELIKADNMAATMMPLKPKLLFFLGIQVFSVSDRILKLNCFVPKVDLNFF